MYWDVSKREVRGPLIYDGENRENIDWKSEKSGKFVKNGF